MSAPWTDPIADTRKAGWHCRFGDRQLRVEGRGGVVWMTPARLGLSAETIAMIEAAEAEGDKRRQVARKSA